MSHEVHIHAAQTSILRELLFRPAATYTELQKPTGLSSDHFNFHVKRLIEVGFITKVKSGTYALTTSGKEYSNKLDTDSNTIERQPKVAVLLAITREHKGEVQYLFQERLKHPYYGYWGYPTGKIRWGETVLQTAARELMEETGLQADTEYKGIYHEHTFQEEDGALLEDKIFFVVLCTNVTGNLIEQFEGGRNTWLNPKEMAGKKRFNSFETELAISQDTNRRLHEEMHSYTKVDF
jgi:8-oxo-dGTP diphosphatase